MSLPVLVSVGDGTHRAHVLDHRSSQPELSDSMPTPRSARAREVTRALNQSSLRGAYAPPARGARALYVPSPRKVSRDAESTPPRQLLARPVRRSESQRVLASDAGSSRPPQPTPWWWPENLGTAAEGLPRSLASLLASQMVQFVAGSSDPAEGPTPALPPEARKRAIKIAETPLKLVNAAVRTRVPPGPLAPSWAQFEVPVRGGQWRGDLIAPSTVRTQEVHRAGNEKVFESADALVQDSDVHDGPMVLLSPDGCKFTGDPVRMSFAIDQLVEGHEGDAFVVVMRRRSGGAAWAPLEENERLTVSPSGVAVVELREFSWVKAWCFCTENQDNDVANLIRQVFTAGMQASRSKHEGKAANQLGYVGIAPEALGYLIPGVAAIATIAAADGALKVLNNPQLAQRTAKEFSADSPLKLLTVACGGYCYPAPSSDGLQENIQIAFLSHPVPDGEEISKLATDDLEAASVQQQESAQVGSDVEAGPTRATGGVEVDLVQSDGATPIALLFSAARRGDSAEVERLLALGVGVNSTDDDGFSALMAASGGDQPVVVSQLLEQGAARAVDLVNMHGETALLLAAHSGSAGATELLLKSGAKVDMIDHDGQTATLIAARIGNAAVITQLIDSGAELNPENGEMPLHAAAENNHVDVVRLLLEGGADVDKADLYGNTALMNAAVAGHADVVSQLLGQGAKADLQGSGGQTALMKAAKANRGECVTALVNGNASLDDGDVNGNTALMLAASNGHAQVVKQLLGSGTSTIRRNDAGQSVMDVAKQFAGRGQRHGADSNQSDDAIELLAVLEAWERERGDALGQGLAPEPMREDATNETTPDEVASPV